MSLIPRRPGYCTNFSKMHFTRKVSLDTLPNDVISEILKTLSTFSDLRSLLLTHRTFNNAWTANRNGVKRAIAQVQFQPFDEALKLLQYQTEPAPEPVLEQAMPEEEEGEEATVQVVPIDVAHLPLEHLTRLVSNTHYINTREAAFFENEPWPSVYDTNVALSPAEQLRYRRAMYRIWQQLLRPNQEFFRLPLVELLELKEVSRRLWSVPLADGAKPRVPKGLPGKWREVGAVWQRTVRVCMVGRMEELRRRRDGGLLVKRLRDLGAGDYLYTVSVVLEDGREEARELERIEEEWLREVADG